ncbi:MAG: hypothetical protein AB7S81_05055 [Bdellovibrionales bacterium]
MSQSSFESSLAALKAKSSEKGTRTDSEKHKGASRWMGFLLKKDVPLVALEERIALRAMISFVARETGASEFKIERDLVDFFGVPNLHYLPAESYERAVSFLSGMVVAGR